MSLTRHFFREVAPLFRMLEQPFGRIPSFYESRDWNRFDPFRDFEVRPAIDVTERGDKFVLDAELPGVNKENISVRVGDDGRSITIEGKVVEKNSPRAAQVSEGTTEALAKSERLSVEREFSHNVRFTRTVWLPRPIDNQDVTAKLENGVLTILAKKGDHKATTTIPVQ